MAEFGLAQRLGALISADQRLAEHPSWPLLTVILGGETSVSTAGFPYISDSSFRLFADQVPHLFSDGADLLSWLTAFEQRVIDGGMLEEEDRLSAGRAARVVRTMAYTAAVTAPPDLWVLRQVLAAHRRSGVLALIAEGDPFDAAGLAAKCGLEASQLSIDLHLLHARGYLDPAEGGYVISSRASLAEVLSEIPDLEPPLRIDWIPELVALLESPDSSSEGLDDLLTAPDTVTGSGTWAATVSQIELGFRLVPLVLALRVSGLTEALVEGSELEGIVGPVANRICAVLSAAGLVEGTRVTRLGARVFERGPGPFGIIAAYHPYFAQLDDLLRPGGHQVWVRRAQNVAASQDANARTFATANDALDRFCSRYGFQYSVFIEHAVGQGEAVRQRYGRDGGGNLRYFGADLEDAAIDQAEQQQALGRLPANMEFIRRADIGEPERVIEFLRSRQIETEGAVMMVGNGFHEIRDQTHEKMTAVFSGYEQAGMVVIFTEETALSDRDLRNTAWNTYHAGFRYVHEMSGQGLRPSQATEGDGARWSWHRCASEGGYVVLEDFSYRTRTIYPYRRPDRDNPSISMSYFCVPRALAARLGIEAGG